MLLAAPPCGAAGRGGQRAKSAAKSKSQTQPRRRACQQVFKFRAYQRQSGTEPRVSANSEDALTRSSLHGAGSLLSRRSVPPGEGSHRALSLRRKSAALARHKHPTHSELRRAILPVLTPNYTNGKTNLLKSSSRRAVAAWRSVAASLKLISLSTASRTCKATRRDSESSWHFVAWLPRPLLEEPLFSCGFFLPCACASGIEGFRGLVRCVSRPS